MKIVFRACLEPWGAERARAKLWVAGDWLQMSPTLSDAFVELVARRLQTIAEPTRIRLLLSLELGEATVEQMADELASSPQMVSKHLCLLHRSGVISRRRDGRRVWYSLADYSACRLIEQTAASVTGYVEELAGIAGLESTG